MPNPAARQMIAIHIHKKVGEKVSIFREREKWNCITFIDVYVQANYVYANHLWVMQNMLSVFFLQFKRKTRGKIKFPFASSWK